MVNQQITLVKGETNRPRKPKRRWPRTKELAPLFDLRPKLPTTGRSLERCADVQDIRLLAMRKVPRMVFDFVDGAAGSETSLSRARDLFKRLELEPRALRDVSDIDLSMKLLGSQSALPFYFSPTGGTRLMHDGGEELVAYVAQQNGIPYTLSTLGNTSIEAVAEAAADGELWFQLYLPRNRQAGEELIRRALASGYTALMIAIDCPVPGRRNRDVRNGLVVPPKMTWGSILKVVGYPRWWFDKLTTEPIDFKLIDSVSERPEQRMRRVFDPTITVEDIAWIRSVWPGKLAAKGVLSAEDAAALSAAGVDAVILSSHGGRQLDNAPLPLELISKVREVVSSTTEIYVDGGVMTGSDIAACFAMGADGVGIGRAYLYGLMAGGQAGIQRVVDLLTAEVRTSMALLGCKNIAELRGIAARVRP